MDKNITNQNLALGFSSIWEYFKRPNLVFGFFKIQPLEDQKEFY
jgi:hypothetical protein